MIKYKIFYSAFLIFTLNIGTLFAQKTELNLALNSGLFNFTGPGASNNSSFNYNANTNTGYVNNSWGKELTLSYGLSGAVKYITKSNFLLHADLGIELLRNKKDLLAQTGTPSFAGQSTLTQTFLNLYPSFGYRFNTNSIAIDLLIGIDLAYSLNANEEANVTSNTGLALSIDRKLETIDFDLRPRPQVGLTYQNYGLYLAYSVGTKNYQDRIVGSPNHQVNANYLRFGINYKLK